MSGPPDEAAPPATDVVTEEPPGGDGESLSGGHYRLGAPVTALVRTARDTWADADVVAVALAPGGDGAGDALTRCARDTRRAAAHPHPALAPVRDVAAGVDRQLWLVHDVPAGARGLADAGPLPAARLLHHAQQLAEALAAAHAARLVHGRVGPDVVLVGPGDEVRLLGTPSGVRPDDRAVAEDDDVRALAAVLAAVPTADATVDPDGDLSGRLAAALADIAGARPETAGTLGAGLRAALRGLAGADPEEPVRRTEVISTVGVTERWSPPVARSAAPPGRAVTRAGAPGSPAPPAAPPRPAPYGGPAPHARPLPRPPRTPPAPPPPGPPPSRRTGWLVAAVAVVLVLLVLVLAVVLRPDGPDAPARPVAPGDRVVPAVVGDPGTAEPCALVDPAALAPGGSARVIPDLGSPAACTFDALAPAGETVVVATLEPVATEVVAAPEERVGALLVRRPAPRSGVCSRTVVTTEGVQVALDAVAPPGSTADPCPAADAATDSTVRTLSAGTPLPRRATADPPGALTAADTCALLTPADLGTVPGLDATRVAPGTGGWSCRWGGGPGAGSVVDVGVERRRTVTPTADVGGRPATVTPRDGACGVALVQRSYTAVDGSPRVELLEVTVAGARPPDALCADATRLAAATVPRLPAP
ncbi:hypothetical protein GCM10023200_60090 [Actinomycetospora chlora]|uniref:Protein kinase domain-containing protein n=1 Tax=Actinomycetospora chlora TaxID=663608 RepID=A0ABP9CN29_9PSEU